MKTERLNLLVDVKSKRRAFRIATDRRLSIGKLFEELVEKEASRVGLIAAAGQGAAK